MKQLSLFVFFSLIGCAFSANSEELIIAVSERSFHAGDVQPIAFFRAEDEAGREAFLALWKEAKKAFPRRQRNLFGPDSRWVEITLKRGWQKLTVRSWHPLFEDNPNSVVTSRGVESLNGRTREEVLESDELWYQNARKCFDKIVSFAKTHAGDS